MLITFEGINSSGKSTLSTLLFSVLTGFGINCLHLTFPSKQFRKFIMENTHDQVSKDVLFLADMRNHLKQIDTFRKSGIVITDRYYYSTKVYGIDPLLIDNMVTMLDLPEPDHIFFTRIGLEGQALNDYVMEQRAERQDLIGVDFTTLQTKFGTMLPVEYTTVINTLNPVVDNFYDIYTKTNELTNFSLPVKKQLNIEQINDLISRIKST